MLAMIGILPFYLSAFHILIGSFLLNSAQTNNTGAFWAWKWDSGF